MGAAPNEALLSTAELTHLSLFSRALPASLLDLGKVVRWLPLAPGGRVSSLASPQEPEHYFFVYDGQISAILDPQAGNGEAPPSPDPKKARKEWQHLAAFGKGDFFSDEYLRRRADSPEPAIDCVADVHSVLCKIPKKSLGDALTRDRALAQALGRKNAELRSLYQHNRSSARRMIQDFFLRHGLGFARTTKVVQLDRCIGCDACEAACAARHGASRLSRVGPSLGVLAFPIACRACVDHRCLHACGFDAISIAEDGTVLTDRMKCVGCSACAASCPNGAIQMVQVPYTAADFPNPMPDTDAAGKTNVPSLYLVGEAAGDALIKMAINSGVRAVEDLAKEPRNSSPPGVVDLAVVGAGPAGLAAALAAREKGLSFHLFDKGDFATTIQNYPRHKMVMAEPAHIPLYGKLWLKDTTREELIAKWEEIIATTHLEIHRNEAVTGVSPEGDRFAVKTSRGSYRARAVIVAVGTRGTPRKLGVSGETEARVKYVLSDPSLYAHKKLLVVGGGDSAVEAAMSLAEVAGTKVALSYRKDSFGRIKAKNKSRLAELEKKGKVRVLLSSQVKSITADKVTLGVPGKTETLGNDVIFAMLGAEPPTKFFEEIGIRIIKPGTPEMDALAASRGNRQFASKCDRCHGFADAACIAACPTAAMLEVDPQQVFFARRKDAPSGVAHERPFLLGIDKPETGSARFLVPAAVISATILTVLMGLEVFLRQTAPELSVTRGWLAPAGVLHLSAYEPGRGLGLGLGIAGSVLMLIAGLYPVHSRLGMFKDLAKKTWFMTLHVWAGLLGPVLVTYHTSLKLDRWPSIAFFAAWLVVLTGIVGRYLRSWMRRGAGLAELELQTLTQARARLRQRWGNLRGGTRLLQPIRTHDWLVHPPLLLAPWIYVGHMLKTTAQAVWLQAFGLRHVPAPSLKTQTLQSLIEHARATRRRMLADAATRTVVWWRRFHLGVSILMASIATTHIILGLLYMAH
ncbi:MAG: NAD(P)-binding domain-containing protein [Deltaproteobacteria bacterium]|nr:NAD(P)-binding domain-containing protein [Deltaproteobacteria bacterium]